MDDVNHQSISDALAVFNILLLTRKPESVEYTDSTHPENHASPSATLVMRKIVRRDICTDPKHQGVTTETKIVKKNNASKSTPAANFSKTD